MTKTSTRLVALVMALVLVLSLFVMAMTVTVSAAGASADPYTNLVSTISTGQYTYKTQNKTYDYSQHRYELSGGGYILYISLWNMSTVGVNASAINGGDLFSDDFERLKSGAKQDFLKDVFTLANCMATDTVNGYASGSGAVTDDTVTDMMNAMQHQSGMGATLLASLLQNTKPDYVSANRFYEPFSGVVGTILGVISILLMAALGVTMALDLAYITIPAFQMALGGTNEGGHGDKSKGIGGIISQEAKKAVQAADGGQGGQAGSGEYKAAVGIYFKYRWKGLVLLGLCLLYLVQGQIYSFVAWFIDLFSGFLGF